MNQIRRLSSHKPTSGAVGGRVLPTATCKDPIIDEVIEMMRDELRVTDRSIIFNADLGEAPERDNMLAQAKVSLHSAIGLTESRRTRSGRLSGERRRKLAQAYPTPGSKMTVTFGSTTRRSICNRCRTSLPDIPKRVCVLIAIPLRDMRLVKIRLGMRPSLATR